MTATLLHTIRKPVETVEEFEQWLATQPQLAEKRFEFVDGEKLEKSGMKPEEFFIVKFLTRLFVKTQVYEQGDELLTESDTYINEHRKRIADLAYFTAKQIEDARKNIRPKTLFAIEILSPSETLVDIEQKLRDYFSAGAKLVWYISPNKQRIYAYTAADEVKIYSGNMVCAAEPVLPDFSFRVEEMFA